MPKKQIIKKLEAMDLMHDFIVFDALEDDNNPDLATYLDVINKIKHIESTYTTEEIREGNLLVDIW